MRSLLLNEEPPTCFIRIDRSHFVKSLFRSKQLQRVDKKKANLFRRIVGYIIQSSSLEEIEIIAKDLFTIINFEFIDSNVSGAKERLMKLVESHIVEEISSDVKNKFDRDENCNLDNYSVKSDITDQKVNKAAIENFFYSPNLMGYFIKLFVRLPLWSNVMCRKFKSKNYIPSSSGSESNFKNIKHLLKRPHRVDKFSKFHLDHLSGYLKQSLAEHNNTTRKVQSVKPTESFVRKRLSDDSATDDSAIKKKRKKFHLMSSDESINNESSTVQSSQSKPEAADDTKIDESLNNESSTFEESVQECVDKNVQVKSILTRNNLRNTIDDTKTDESSNNISTSFEELLQENFEEN